MGDVSVPTQARRMHAALDALGQLTAQAERYGDAVQTVAEREGLGRGVAALRALVLLATLGDGQMTSADARDALGLSGPTWHRLRAHAVGLGLITAELGESPHAHVVAATDEGRRRLDRALSSLEVVR